MRDIKRESTTQKESQVRVMAVLNIYDINAKANEIAEEFKKMDEEPKDESAILFEEMRILALNNRTRFKL